MRPLSGTVLLLLATGLLTWSAWPAQTALSDTQRAVHLLNRFAYGPRPADMDLVRRIGPAAWLEAQLRPEHLSDTTAPVSDKRMTRDALVQRKLWRDVKSDRQLQEILVDFWFNHFNVNSNKVDANTVARYEDEVIRPHCMGHFRDLLGAVAHSPAMLDYLDNSKSRKASIGKNNVATGGINENYARELMELHTLGVNGGYTQADIGEVARVLTGWTVDRPKDGVPTFKFDERVHDTGPKLVLGFTIQGAGGEAEGEQVLDMLADHPSTARFLATKLCRLLVRDDPPPALVEEVAATYRKTRGDIRAMVQVIFAAPELWEAGTYRIKYKSPLFLVVSSLRTLSATPRSPRALQDALAHMGMPLYQCEPPTGYAERAESWLSAGGLLDRLNFCTDLAANRINGVDVRLEPLLTYVAGPNRSRDAMYQTTNSLINLLVDAPVSQETLLSLQAAVADPNIDYPHLIGLILGSPEFQRR